MSATLNELGQALEQLAESVRDLLGSQPPTQIELLDARIDELQRMRSSLVGWSPTEEGDWAIAREVARSQGNDLDRTWRKARTEKWLADQGAFGHEVMASVFGPEWIHVVALVRRAAALTPQERQDYYDAWLADYNAHSTEYDDAWRAVFVVGGPGDAARRALWAFADGFNALVGAALARRDEVDRKHYDVRTRVWRRVFGPIHPDDEDLR